MTKRKTFKFEELATFPNSFQNFSWEFPVLINNAGEEIDKKGKWNEEYFQNDKPIVMELACGYAEYTTWLSQYAPNTNFIAVDIKGNRIWRGAKNAIDLKLDNTAFVRTEIRYLPLFFGPDEVDQIWIIFPDPFEKKNRIKNRLTSPPFLDRYRQFVKKDGIIHLKTDNLKLYEYTLEVIQEQNLEIIIQCDDIYKHKDLELHPALRAIQTRYEKLHLADGRTIKYIQFRLN